MSDIKRWLTNTMVYRIALQLEATRSYLSGYADQLWNHHGPHIRLALGVYDKESVTFSILDTQMCIVMSVLMAVWLPYDVTLTFEERRISA